MYQKLAILEDNFLWHFGTKEGCVCTALIGTQARASVPLAVLLQNFVPECSVRDRLIEGCDFSQLVACTA